jgi:nicotinate-nucleotide adenylyltransferase
VSALGILGGSFNPPHLGHLAVADDAVAELGLDLVLLMPVYLPPHRPPAPDDPGPTHRLAMCRALIDGQRRLEVSTLEVERGGRSYTVDTLEAVHAGDPDAELTLILGADMACTLPSWRRPLEIVKLAKMAVARRGPSWEDGGAVGSREQVLACLRSIDPRADAEILSMSPVEISSTMVRERLAQGRPVEDLVGSAVASYIAEHSLYGVRKAAVR